MQEGSRTLLGTSFNKQSSMPTSEQRIYLLQIAQMKEDENLDGVSASHNDDTITLV